MPPIAPGPWPGQASTWRPIEIGRAVHSSAAFGQEWKASVRPLKRSFTIAGHSTSISLEAPFWEALKEAAVERGQSVAALVEEIDAGRGGAGLSSAVRVWILAYYRSRSAQGSEAAPHVPERSSDCG